MGTSLEDLKSFPERARKQSGFDLGTVQDGKMPSRAKVLVGFGGSGVQEIATDDEGGTFRVVYTVRLVKAVYVLHAFQKKSASAIRTSKRDLDLIASRIREAEEHDRNA